MQFQRFSPTQLLVVGPLEAVREAAWYALWSAGVLIPTIDAQKNIVSGSQGDGVLAVVRVVSATLDARPEGVLVSFESKPVMGGGIEFGAAKRRAQKLVESLERVLLSGFSGTPAPNAAPAPATFAAPIADPSGGGNTFVPPPQTMARPLYGEVRAPKRGVMMISYGLLSLIVCPIVAPITIIYGFSTLRDYQLKGDPGDKALVIAGMAVAALDCVAVAAVLGFFFFAR